MNDPNFLEAFASQVAPAGASVPRPKQFGRLARTTAKLYGLLRMQGEVPTDLRAELAQRLGAELMDRLDQLAEQFGNTESE